MMGTETNKEEKNSPEYLAQLLKDKKQIQAFPNVFVHLERLLDEEINKVRIALFHISSDHQPMDLPDPQGPIVTLSEKIFVPVKEYPDFNFVGRILGPRGMTAKQFERDYGCKIMVRGKGSMRDKNKEESNRGKPNWEHLSEDLHVLITVEDTRNRCEIKLRRALEEVKKLLVPAAEGEDDLKKRQLMELAIINGTYRDTKSTPNALPQVPMATASGSSSARMLTPQLTMPFRSPSSQHGAPIILAPRLPLTPTSVGNTLFNGAPPPLVSPAEVNPGFYPYDPYGLATPTLFEYPSGIEQSVSGAAPKMRRTVSGAMREHPYNRVSLT